MQLTLPCLLDQDSLANSDHPRFISLDYDGESDAVVASTEAQGEFERRMVSAAKWAFGASFLCLTARPANQQALTEQDAIAKLSLADYAAEKMKMAIQAHGQPLLNALAQLRPDLQRNLQQLISGGKPSFENQNAFSLVDE